MEGERKKRKMENDDDQEVEDEKMEKFFALIRSTRDARDQLLSVVNGSKEKKVEEEKAIAVWNPSFQPEDFMEVAHSTIPHVTLAAPSNSQREEQPKEEEEEGGNGLDLKLSL